MRKSLGMWVRVVATRSLQAMTVICLFSACVCHAQLIEGCLVSNDYSNSPIPGDPTTITLLTWYSGHTYTVDIKGAWGPVTPPGCEYLQAYVFKMPNGYNDRSTWVLDPAVTVPKPTEAVSVNGISYTFDIQNTTYVDPMNASLSVTVGGTAPETDLLVLYCMNCMFGDRVGYLVDINPPPAAPGPPSCPMPTIASVSPKYWFAGKTFDIAINGNNFITKKAASDTCPETQVWISAPSGETLLQSSPNVISSTQINATVAPAASDPTETATVYLSAPYEQQGPTYKTQIVNLKSVITDTSNIMNGIVTVKLTAPSSTKGDLKREEIPRLWRGGSSRLTFRGVGF